MLFFVYFFRNLPFQNVFHDCGSSYQGIVTSVFLNKTNKSFLHNNLPKVDSIATKKMSKWLAVVKGSIERNGHNEDRKNSIEYILL